MRREDCRHQFDMTIGYTTNPVKYRCVNCGIMMSADEIIEKTQMNDPQNATLYQLPPHIVAHINRLYNEIERLNKELMKALKLDGQND